MDKHQQVFWTDINLRHKNKCPKKRKTINTNGIICLRQKQQNTVSKVPIQHGEHQKKMAKKEFEIVISFISFTDDHSCR